VTGSYRYYDAHAAEFFGQTVAVDLSELRKSFTDLLPPGGSILDAGCGSGRDSKAFTEQGFRVTAFDASAAMVELAQQYTALPVDQLRFEDLTYEEAFDGIWACSSLLHVPITREHAVFGKLASALKPGGVLYASYKLGDGERVEGDRLFRDHTEATLRAFIARHPRLGKPICWETDDLRPGRADRWINCLVRRNDLLHDSASLNLD
jgi:SAM-dependent methyltransferase